MGLPEIFISFQTAAVSAITRSARGVLAVAVKDATAGGATEAAYKSLAEVPEDKFSPENYRLLKLAFLAAPTKVWVLRVGEDAEKTYQALERLRFDWLAAPGLEDARVMSFIKTLRNGGRGVKAVVANATAPDCEGIVNLCVSGLTLEDGAVLAAYGGDGKTLLYPNGGSAIAPITQDYGTAITAPADPTKTGYTFAGWTPAIPATMPAENMTIKAQWRYNGGGSSGYSYYTIKTTAGAGGSISPSGSVSVREGRDQTFTITPDKSYAVSNVKIDGKSIGAVKSYTFENVRRPHTIEVIFMKANGNPQAGVFVDVATGSYYEDAVDWAVGNGITQGTDATHFSPDGICTRAQAVTFLWRAAGSPKPETRTMPFTDVPVGSYYYDAVLWAVENGIAKGTSDTTFSPNMTCTRAQIVAFLWRSEKSPAAGTANPFADVKSAAYYADAILWAVKENITRGTTNTTFSPDADCTRSQIVTFLWRCKK